MARKNCRKQQELFDPLEFQNDRLFFERQAFLQGAKLVAGVDEVGRGPLSGPVVAAAVVFPREPSIRGIDDSKKLKPGQREKLFELIIEHAKSVGVGFVEPDVIDEINILQATRLAMKQAIASMKYEPDHVLVDGYPIPGLHLPQTAIIKGDAKSISIGAASIIAKVVRDKIMVAYSKIYPGYGFEKNKGYGTNFHLHALVKFGPCAIHRLTFRGVKELVK